MENEEKDKKTIFGKVANYKELHVYQKAEVSKSEMQPIFDEVRGTK